MKARQNRARQSQTKKVVDSVWLPVLKACRKLEESWPECARQYKNFALFAKEDRFWRDLAKYGQLLLVQEAS